MSFFPRDSRRRQQQQRPAVCYQNDAGLKSVSRRNITQLFDTSNVKRDAKPIGGTERVNNAECHSPAVVDSSRNSITRREKEGIKESVCRERERDFGGGFILEGFHAEDDGVRSFLRCMHHIKIHPDSFTPKACCFSSLHTFSGAIFFFSGHITEIAHRY